MHVWSLDAEKQVLTTHVVMTRDAARADLLTVKHRAREVLDREAFEHVTVDIELEGEQCLAEAAPESKH